MLGDFKSFVEKEKPHPIECLEPATPLLKHNKRPSDGVDMNQRPKKKAKSKKKRHRPKVIVEGRHGRTVKNLPPKKEKRKYARKNQAGKDEKRKYVRKGPPVKKGKTSSKETSTSDNHTEIIAINSSLLNVVNKTSVDNVVATMQSGVGGDRGSEGSYFSFPKSCKKIRIKRRRKSNVSILLGFYNLKGHTKKKRSFRRQNMASAALCNHMPNIGLNLAYHELEICKDSQVGLLEKILMSKTKGNEKESVLKPLDQLPISEEKGEVNYENNATECSFKMGRFEQNRLQLIVRPRGTPNVFNYEAIDIKKDKEVFFRGIDSIKKFMSQTISKIGAVVPPQGFLSSINGAIVPHQGSIPMKNPKSKLKPLVALDSETVRRWIQIKRKEDGIGGVGEEKEEVNEEREEEWEEERRIFKGRIDSFTSKMHIILGNRRFKPWNGSVVDSVVGVYLTQNVSDYLSSSAYMALASNFPVKTNNEAAFDDDLEKQNCQESTGSTGTKRDSCSDTESMLDTQEDVREMGFVDIEDIGNLVLPQKFYGHEQRWRCQNPEEKKINPSSNSKILNGVEATPGSKSPPDFHEFIKMCFGSSGVCHGIDNFEPLGDNQAENLVEDKASLATSFLPQEYSQAEPGIKRNPASQVNDKEKVQRSEGASIPDASATSMQNEKVGPAPKEARRTTPGKKKVEKRDWDSLRRKYSRPRTQGQTDSVDWEAVRQTDTNLIAEIIKARGQHTIIAERIKGFLDHVVKLHGRIDLEWLRYAPPNLVKEYLLEIRGLGLKSVECIRLLALHHVAFPVDVNVARLAVRLGWVPLQPLPGDLQFHLLEEYPIMDTVQQYLWPRLCTFDQLTLYELHYQMITFGKIFCTKRSPNCSSCPMRAECRHFASAVASANLSLPSSSNEGVDRSIVPCIPAVNSLPFQGNEVANEMITVSSEPGQILNSEYFVELPGSPEHEQNSEEFGRAEDDYDGEDNRNDEEELPTIKLDVEEWRENVQHFVDKYRNDLEDGNLSRAIVPLSLDAESLPIRKLKVTIHLRTEHNVYEIPDDHTILIGLEKRDPEDSVPYLLAIWTAGETPISVEQPKKRCNYQGTELCNDQTCFSCQTISEARAHIVRGTILVPCRTAMRGRFPLNGTYFQVNEVFADHESSHKPIVVPRESIWKLRRRTVYFGTSPSAIFRKGCSLKDIQENFWRGFICLRGWDRATRAPQPLALRFHCSPSKKERTPRRINLKVEKTPKKVKRKLEMS